MAAGHRRHDRDFRLLAQWCGQTLEETHILIVDKDIHETVHATVAIQDAGFDAWKSSVQIFYQLDQRSPVGLHDSLISRQFP